MIRVDSLTRTYGDFTAVDRVSFDIDKGEIVGLLGHNGAGKTTIMKMITGFLEPTAGTIKVAGMDVEQQGLETRKLIGYLPENCPIYREMTVIEYLEYAAALHDIPEARRAAAVREAIARTELEAKALKPIGTLSRGLRQRVGVAQAILHQPQILILDEPTNGLDPTQIQHMRELIHSLAESATVILSTHILQEVQAMSDRVIILRGGQKVLDDRLENLQAGKRLLVSVDAAPETAAPLFNAMEEVDGVEDLGSSGQHHRYALGLATGTDAAAPAVARKVLDGGHKLYSLTPESRDLETIFGEISAR
jgi:ABC-2 type transport system ATP-binding protein